MQLELREPATITMRYSPLINEQLLIYKGSDAQPFEVISIDDVEERHVWLEIKVQRKVSAR
nr:MAG TPA: putative head-tail adaptor [Caudoviricetes sp.]